MRSLLASLWLALTLTASAAPYGLETRPAFAAYNGGTLPTNAALVAGTWSTVEAYPNLTFINPLGVLPMPGTNQMVVWEREGRIWGFSDDQAISTKTLLLDLHNQCQGWDDEGLLGLAFHPNFANNHYVYVWYNWVAPGTVKGDMNTRPPNSTSTHQRLARFTYDPVAGVLIRSSEYVLIDQIDHNTWHNGGGMFFHPTTGFLYLTNGNDADGNNDQRIDHGFFGCLLRIDVDKQGGNVSHPPTQRAFEEVGPNWPTAYYVPNDNPFVGQAGALEEIYALGLRSPHRATVDPATQRIFIGDVGEGNWEEIDTIEPGDPAGFNFQWSSSHRRLQWRPGAALSRREPPAHPGLRAWRRWVRGHRRLYLSRLGSFPSWWASTSSATVSRATSGTWTSQPTPRPLPPQRSCSRPCRKGPGLPPARATPGSPPLATIRRTSCSFAR